MSTKEARKSRALTIEQKLTAEAMFGAGFLLTLAIAFSEFGIQVGLVVFSGLVSVYGLIGLCTFFILEAIEHKK